LLLQVALVVVDIITQAAAAQEEFYSQIMFL
jgi:hypothetical protein